MKYQNTVKFINENSSAFIDLESIKIDADIQTREHFNCCLPIFLESDYNQGDATDEEIAQLRIAMEIDYDSDPFIIFDRFFNERVESLCEDAILSLPIDFQFEVTCQFQKIVDRIDSDECQYSEEITEYKTFTYSVHEIEDEAFEEMHTEINGLRKYRINENN